MDGLRIKMHPTIDILCREDGAILMPKGWTFGAGRRGGYVLNAADYGVRFKDNPNAYKVAWSHTHPDRKRQSAAKYNQKQKSKGLVYSKCADGRCHWHKPGEDPWTIR